MFTIRRWGMTQPMYSLFTASVDARPVPPVGPGDCKLVVMLPALNEERTIGNVISRIPKQIPGIAIIESLVVNDASIDNTEAVAITQGATVVSHRRRVGLGTVFQTGLDHALRSDADIIVSIDADGQFDACHIPTLIRPILDGEAGLVTATRFANPEFTPQMPAVKLWGNRWVTRIVNVITGKRFTDTCCGFRAYSRDAALRLTLFARFTYTQETLIDAAFKGIEIAEIPIQVRGEREHGTSRIAASLWRYAVQSGCILLLAARDHRPLHLFGIPGVVLVGLGVGVEFFMINGNRGSSSSALDQTLRFIMGAALTGGMLLCVASLLADMIRRTRTIMEATYYLVRRDANRKSDSE